MSPLAPAARRPAAPPRPPARPRRAAAPADPFGDPGPFGKPSPALLRNMGEPADGTPLTDAEYERLTTEFRAELVDGRLDYVPMPDDLHARIVRHLNWALENCLRRDHPGAALAGQDIRVLVRSGRRREPDLVVLLDGEDARRGRQYWTGADLCIEVVSPDDPSRDHTRKRADYAATGVPEYWVVDPRERTDQDPRGRAIRVLTLDGDEYRETVFEDGDTATGPLLGGFAVDVAACLAGA